MNDFVNYIIIRDFFEYLVAGFDKDVALQKAKLNYLNNNLDDPPVLWAFYRLYGNAKPMFSVN